MIIKNRSIGGKAQQISENWDYLQLGQAHHMFSQFLNLLNFLCFAFLKEFFLRSKITVYDNRKKETFCSPFKKGNLKFREKKNRRFRIRENM